MGHSRKAFINDYICRNGSSVDNNYLFLSDCKIFDPVERAGFLFSKMQAFLIENVKLTRNGEQYHRPTRISFDAKMGWILRHGTTICFLGKLSVERKLSLRIGHGTYFSGEVFIRGSGMLEIGNFCGIAAGVQFYSSEDRHPLGYLSHINFNAKYRIEELGFSQINPDYSEVPRRDGLSIGNNVWIARDATIKQGLSIGDGAVIGERSYVNRSVNPFCMHAGLPAKLIRKLHKHDEVTRLLKLAWWYWPNDKILNNKSLFEKPVVENWEEIDRYLLDE